MDDDIALTPPVAQKKDAPKEEPAETTPSKPTPPASSKGTPTTSKTAKGKRKINGDDVKPSINGAPPKKVKTENVCHDLR